MSNDKKIKVPQRQPETSAFDKALELLDVTEATFERFVGGGYTKPYRYLFDRRTEIPEARLLHLALLGIATVQDRKYGTRRAPKLLEKFPIKDY